MPMMSDYAIQPCHGLTPLAPTGAPKPPPVVLPWPIPSVPPLSPSGRRGSQANSLPVSAGFAAAQEVHMILKEPHARAA